MTLILKTLSYKGLPPNQEISAQFDAKGGTIGRAPDNHLVLPDPEKFTSRLHASIVFEAGQYFIQDSSTGGTYLNNSQTPLQQGRAPLHNGEKLRIGEYELLVSILDSATAGFGRVIETPVRQLDLADNSIMDGPFASSQPAQAKPDFFSSFHEQPESSIAHESFTPPNVSQTVANPAEDDLDFDDLLSKLDALPGASSSHSSSFQSAELPVLPDDFFAEDQFIPEQPASTPAEESIEPVTPHLEPGVDAEPADVFNQPDVFATEEIPVFKTIEPSVVPFEAAEEVIEQPNAPQPISSAQVAPVPAATMPADDFLLREFLAGAGITDPNFLPAEQWPALMRTSGELLRSMVEGLMQVLRARAELKSQFRVSVTTMRSIDNNPLKFTPNVDDAMRLILAPTNPGFLPPKQAVKGGFSDIMNHQIAMTAGIQAALAEILHGFDPQLIEKNQAEGVLFQKKAKCWEYYVEKYPQLKAVAQEEFFGDAFADAYEKQMLLLSRATKNP